MENRPRFSEIEHGNADRFHSKSEMRRVRTQMSDKNDDFDDNDDFSPEGNSIKGVKNGSLIRIRGERNYKLAKMLAEELEKEWDANNFHMKMCHIFEEMGREDLLRRQREIVSDELNHIQFYQELFNELTKIPVAED